MSANAPYDVLIVGTGPAGAAACLELAGKGLRVGVVDVGNTPPAHNIKGRFYDIKRAPGPNLDDILGPNHEYLIGIFGRYVMPKNRPPKFRYVLKDAERLTPVVSDNFQGNFSYSLGGLANIWGGQLVRYDDADLKEFPFGAAALEPYYRRLDQEIGISGENDDLARFYGAQEDLLPPLRLMDNGRCLLRRYRRWRQHLNARGVYIGRPRAGILTRPHNGRPAHAYEAVEFFRPDVTSVYSPAYTMERLIQEKAVEYLPGLFAERFTEFPDKVELTAREVRGGGLRRIAARSLLLCAGAMGSARLALNSLATPGTKIAIADNLLSYIPFINPTLLGAPQDVDSLYMQLNLCYKRPEQPLVMGTFYGISGLLVSDFLTDTPVTFPCAVKLVPLMTSAMMVLHLWHASRPDISRNQLWIDESGAVHVNYTDTLDGRVERELIGQMLKLGYLALPGWVKYPQAGNSFHYSGTLPMREHPGPFETAPDGLLHGTARVYAADGAAFTALSAKNLSLTIMANAMRVADRLGGSLLAAR